MSRESFEKWLKDAYHGHQSQRVNKEAWWAYQAGQIEQRESDAKLCEGWILKMLDHEVPIGIHIADAIRANKEEHDMARVSKLKAQLLEQQEKIAELEEEICNQEAELKDYQRALAREEKLEAQLEAAKMPVEYFEEGQIIHAVYGSSSIAYVKKLEAKIREQQAVIEEMENYD